MSAWYLFAMMGLYPLRMGAPEYVIGSPMFERVDVRLDNGRTLRVIAHGNGPENVYVQSLTLDGRPWNRPWLRHGDIADGATLEFTMGPEPSRWGSAPDALPSSLTEAGRMPVQRVDRSAMAHLGVEGQDARAEALVDDDAATSLPLAPRAAIVARFDKPIAIAHYTLTSGAEPLSDSGWALEGRDASGSWTLLDERRGETFRWARQLRPFDVGAPGEYLEYRLRFSGDSAVELAELELQQSTRAERRAPASVD